jgi:hypothetical protein
MPDAELVHQLHNDLTLAGSALSLLAEEPGLAAPSHRLATVALAAVERARECVQEYQRTHPLVLMTDAPEPFDPGGPRTARAPRSGVPQPHR